jgi:hypothetical protein
VSLTELIESPTSRIDEIAAFLDQGDHAHRWAAIGQASRDQQRALYEKAAEAPPLDLAFFAGDEPGREVIHEGLNTLPLPGGFRRFQKRFCTSPTPDRVFGYNEGPTRRLVGPGYFVGVLTEGRPEWESRGAVVIDYYRVPDGPVVAGWPRVIANKQGLQRFVYHETRDFMRRVSTHISIGAAFKRGRPLDHYFVLCRV